MWEANPTERVDDLLLSIRGVSRCSCEHVWLVECDLRRVNSTVDIVVERLRYFRSLKFAFDVLSFIALTIEKESRDLANMLQIQAVTE